jgi:hypothetical protein
LRIPRTECGFDFTVARRIERAQRTCRAANRLSADQHLSGDLHCFVSCEREPRGLVSMVGSTSAARRKRRSSHGWRAHGQPAAMSMGLPENPHL